jgi:tetratricopeptide (TPR) repeat protein
METESSSGGDPPRRRYLAASPDGKPHRRRLEALYEHGTKVSREGQFDYATDLYIQCVYCHPSNPNYVRAYLANLCRKYDNNKKGSPSAALRAPGSRAAVKEAAEQKKWDALLRAGLEGLKHNPWDIRILSDLADACEQQGFHKARDEYLQQALEA